MPLKRVIRKLDDSYLAHLRKQVHLLAVYAKVAVIRFIDFGRAVNRGYTGPRCDLDTESTANQPTVQS